MKTKKIKSENLKSSYKKTLEKLRIKAEAGAFGKARIPSIASLSKMLTEMGVVHTCFGSKKRLVIKPSIEMAEKSKVNYIDFDSSETYYSANNDIYAMELVQYLIALGKIK